MSTRRIAAILLLFSCTASAVQALECRKPKSPLPLPNGKDATRKEMADAARRVRQYNEDMEAHLGCLLTVTQQQGVGVARKEARAADQAREAQHNEAVAELTGVANCLNIQLREFKATGGGKGSKQPADCSEAMAAATAGAESNASTIRKVPVNDSAKRSVALPAGTFSYFLRRGGDLVQCFDRRADDCDVNRLVIHNVSPGALECTTRLSYSTPNDKGELRVEGRAALRPGEERVVLRDSSQVDNVPSYFAECRPRAAVSVSTGPDECKYRITKPVLIQDYYPEESRALRHEGPVIVEFTLAKGVDTPNNLNVAFSSMYDDLDRAALLAVRSMEMSADCGPQRHRLAIHWELKEE